MKKTAIILSILALTASSYGQTTKANLPEINEQFISYFPDMVLGKYNEDRKLIPKEVVTKFLPDFEELINPVYDTEINYYAIGKINNYKGFDLFIFERTLNKSVEEHLETHYTDSIQYVLFFKDGIPVINKSLDSRTISVIGRYKAGTYDYSYNASYKMTNKSYFDTDNTIITSWRCSDTEYDTPFIFTTEYRWELKDNGKGDFLEYRKAELSSPFYDCKYLKEQNFGEYYLILPESSDEFPTKGSKWRIDFNRKLDLYDSDLVIYENLPALELRFHIDRIDGELMPIFESYDEEEDEKRLIDRYIVGQLDNKPVDKSDIEQFSTLKCPVIIRTSDGDLKFLPNGKFVLQ